MGNHCTELNFNKSVINSYLIYLVTKESSFCKLTPTSNKERITGKYPLIKNQLGTEDQLFNFINLVNGTAIKGDQTKYKRGEGRYIMNIVLYYCDKNSIFLYAPNVLRDEYSGNKFVPLPLHEKLNWLVNRLRFNFISNQENCRGILHDALVNDDPSILKNTIEPGLFNLYREPNRSFVKNNSSIEKLLLQIRK